MYKNVIFYLIKGLGLPIGQSASNITTAIWDFPAPNGVLKQL